MLRRLAILEATIGAFISLAASGRLTPRLMIDGAISFAFIPILEIAAFWIVYRATARPARPHFTDELNRFLAGNRPWLVWLVVCGGVLAVLSPRSLTLSIVRGMELSAILPAISALRTDARFFGNVAGLPRRYRPALAVRAVAWPLGITYFLGIAIWSLVQPSLVAVR